jgi:hypothetical protein
MAVPFFVGSPPLGIPFKLNRTSPQARGLVAWWPTVGQSHGKLMDYSGGAHHGTFAGNAALKAWPTVGRVLDLDGTGDVVTVSHQARLAPIHKSIAVWAYLDTTSGVRTMVKKDSDYILRMDNATLSLYVWRGGFYQLPGPSLSTGILYHIVGTWNDNTATLYVNGFSATTATPGSGTTTSTNGVGIGAAPDGSEAFDGLLGDVRIYDRALTASEVLALYLPQTRFDLYAPLWKPAYYVPPVVAGQPMALRQSQILTGVRRWGKGF